MCERNSCNRDIGYYVKNLDNHIQRYFHCLYDRRAFQECSLSNMRILTFVHHRGENPPSQRDIEAEFSVNRATASKTLSLMEEKGLIQRVSSPKDRRIKLIQLTDKGRGLGEECIRLHHELESVMSSVLSPEEEEQFKGMCERMIENIQHSCDQQGRRP
jgi:DNA-binding MarR family transcriptional regulator